MKEYVLVVDDEQSLRRLLELFFRKEGFEVDTAGNLAEAEAAIGTNAYDLVLTDLRMAGEDDGLKVLRAALQKNPWTQVIVLTAYGTVETAKEAIKYGAYDYIAKPFDNSELRKIVRSSLARKEDDAGRRKALRESVRGTSAYEGIVGRSEAMLGVFELIDRVAPTDANVMILGESGTGKELVAAALHHRSNRKDQPFVPINCAAIPETLLESELFGHVRGAFTGAVQTKKGLFEAAHRGTLFLDEVGELPLPMQGKLLRALQERVFRRVGGNEDLSIDFRTVCASKRDLHREMAESRFRDDLYFRLNVIQIFVPPLRDRREDIPALAAHFMRKFAQKHGKPIERIDGEAMRALLAHDFPGNVRELENILERATIMETKNVISLGSLPPNVTKIVIPGPLAGDEIQELLSEEGVFLDQAMDRLEKKHLLKALEATGGNRTEAAKILNISLRSMRYRLQKHSIE
ncbi:MAG: two component system response regulator, sigma54-specific [Deltaproteobacteria bacterium]|nr:two component system response regulator, sigma54-specific [Deltaproteobacteria bacterium]